MKFFNKNKENTLLFIIFLIIYLIVAYYFTIVLQTHHNDTISRSALGYMVLYGRYAKLTNVGFVWTPLISLLQLPMFPILKLFNHQEFAGTILTAIVGAATLPVLNSIAVDLDVNKWVRRAAIILYALNPTVLLYVGVGMSETFFFLPFAIYILYLIKWMAGKMRYTALVISGSALALSFWARYETMPILLAACITILLYIYEHRINNVSLNHLIEAGIITFLVPGIYSIFIWIFFNWTIMGNPMYWWTGEYSNAAYTSVYQVQVNPLYHNLLSSGIYALERVMYISPLLIVVLIFSSILAIRNKTWMPLLVSISSWVLVVFHIYQVFTGTSYGWYRFYSYGIIGGVWGFFWLWNLVRENRTFRIIFEIVSIVVMALGYITTAYAMSQPEIGKEEYSLISSFLPGGQVSNDELRSFGAARAVDQYFRENHVKDPVLLDSFQGFAIILFADDPDIFVKTQDPDFSIALQNPIKYGIKWILAPKPDDSLRYSEWIYRTFPSIWEAPPQWLKLEQDFGAWRLYKVVSGEGL
ncbi:MAG: hypothetical protein LWX83_17830 [Anaerolineae bacterium]|nr:hypothetical protein [Anaerolineae bacterium]